MNVTVVGAGKMGLPLACVFASRGASVFVCDVDWAKVESINAGICPFQEPGVDELLAEGVRSGRLVATTDTGSAIANSEVVVVIVPVLLSDSREAELSMIDDVAKIASANLKPGSMISFETTLPVGGTRRLGHIIDENGMRAGVDYDLVFSPERVKSLFVLKHLFNNPKIVGGITPASAARGAEFYTKYLGAPVINVGTLEAAELVKLAGMIYRDVNIALANELAAFAECIGIDFEMVRQAANTDGESNLLLPGIGVGGHCTPVYPYFLISEARSRGIPVELAELGRKINSAQPRKILNKVGDVQGKKCVILGVSFRPQVKESAYSPVFALASELEIRGASVTVHDPLYTEEEIRRLGLIPGEIEGNEILILNTAHDAYLNLDFADLARKGVKCVVDGRNAWSVDAVVAAGIRYIGVGRSTR
ncbi:MAG: nucleotide sugar dehydrogenase [Armatimonadetes bacterium]|nr:nucleotide sugar dehydrogenase [Armatimonadota bacterium]